MFCWNGSQMDANPLPSMSPERNNFYASAFTYNTERQFRNTYSSYEQDDKDDLSPNDTASVSKVIELFFMVLSAILFTFTLPLSLFFCIKFIGSYERAVVTRLGHSRGTKGPGAIFVFPLIDTVTRIDIRIQSFELPVFQVVTVDRGLVEVGIAVFSRVIDPLVTHLCLQNREETLRSLSYNITYNNLVKRTLTDLTDPEGLARIFRKAEDDFNQFCRNMGLEVTQIAVRQLRIVKPAENQAFSLINTIMKSELGEQLMRSLAPAIKAYMSENNQTNGDSANTTDEDNKNKTINMEGLTEKKDYNDITDSINKNLLFSLSPHVIITKATGSVSETSSSETLKDNKVNKEDDDSIEDPEIEAVVRRIRTCCDAQLTAKVNQRYLVYVLRKENDDIEANADCQKKFSSSDWIGILELDLRANTEGSCHWWNNDCMINRKNDKYVGFALRKEALLALANGTLTPFDAYINGTVEIIEGSITDAIPLRFLAECASPKQD